jgi:hypothetical protein
MASDPISELFRLTSLVKEAGFPAAHAAEVEALRAAALAIKPADRSAWARFYERAVGVTERVAATLAAERAVETEAGAGAAGGSGLAAAAP